MSSLKQSLSLKAALLLLAASIACLAVVDGQGQGQGYSKCIQTKDEFHLLCDCRVNSDDGDYMLVCSLYDEWDYCANPFNEIPVCASVLFGQTFDINGQVTNRFRDYDDVDGVTGTITVQRIPTNKSCVVTVNNGQCNSCEIVDNCDTASQLDHALYEE